MTVLSVAHGNETTRGGLQSRELLVLLLFPLARVAEEMRGVNEWRRDVIRREQVIHRVLDEGRGGFIDESAWVAKLAHIISFVVYVNHLLDPAMGGAWLNEEHSSDGKGDEMHFERRCPLACKEMYFSKVKRFKRL